ncbi:hypothetical protein EYR40_007349 [Pleurotus pulmonarius]|nr:hypothetical protein EYR40_007349 [Pleurotus pulmonarius]
MSNQLIVNDILAVLFSGGDGETYHFAICVVINDTTAVKYHAKEPIPNHWFFERPAPLHSLLQSRTLCAAVKIGKVKPGFQLSALEDYLSQIPMQIPQSEVGYERRFDCRVWFKEAKQSAGRMLRATTHAERPGPDMHTTSLGAPPDSDAPRRV